jgi:hypothetical protein
MTTRTHPWNGEIVVYVDKGDKNVRKVNKFMADTRPDWLMIGHSEWKSVISQWPSVFGNEIDFSYIQLVFNDKWMIQWGTGQNCKHKL